MNDPERFGVIDFSEDGTVTLIEEKPSHPKTNYAVTGLYFYDNRIIEIAKSIELSKRDELEITDVNKAYLERGELSVKLLGQGNAWLDTGTHQSLFKASQFLKTLEENQIIKIACIEEIAYQKGYISKESLYNLAMPLMKNENGDNSTFHRNKQIQILVKELNSYYHQRINSRVQELGLSEQVPYSRVWERAIDDSARKSSHVIHEDSSKVSILFPIPHSSLEKEHSQLFQTLHKGIETNFKEIQVVVVGNIPAEIEAFAAKAPMGAIRWWPMEANDSLETCIQYAKYCASCTEKVVVLP